jgi:hypothetical protein
MDSLALSRRAVASGWKWQKGATAVGFGVVSYHRPADEWSPERVCTADNEHVNDWENTENMLPDFNDAATRGCLLEQMRQRWRPSLGDEALEMAAINMNGKWGVGSVDGSAVKWNILAIHSSEVAALVAAFVAKEAR